MDFFENYAIVAMQSDNASFYACKRIKVTSDFNLKKTFFFAFLVLFHLYHDDLVVLSFC